MQTNLKTIQDVINHLEKIPEKKWCVGQVVDNKGRHCAMGHLNKALRGDPEYDFSNQWFEDTERNDALGLSNRLGFSADMLAAANNRNILSPKTGALEYLKAVQKAQS
jgi:hypothetical protein